MIDTPEKMFKFLLVDLELSQRNLEKAISINDSEDIKHFKKYIKDITFELNEIRNEYIRKGYK